MASKINPNWLTLPILYNGVYPQHIKELADKIEVPVEEIAQKKGVSGQVIGLHTIRRETVQKILSFTQIPDYPDETVIDFIDGSSTVVYVPHKKLIKMVDDFLSLTPTVELIPFQSHIRIINKEEFEEMGENLEED